MNLLDYIQGIKKGRDANRIEKDALRDAFTYEALEGYDQIKGNHTENISKLQKQIRSANKQSQGRNLFIRVSSIVAAIVIGLGIYTVYDIQNSKPSSHSLSAMDTNKNIAIINIFVPDDFYEEHKVVISKNNNTAKKKLLSSSIVPFEVEKQTSAKLSKQEIEELSEIRNKSIIDVFIPDEEYLRNEREIAKGNNRTEIITDTSETTSIDIYIPIEDYTKNKISLNPTK